MECDPFEMSIGRRSFFKCQEDGWRLVLDERLGNVVVVVRLVLFGFFLVERERDMYVLSYRFFFSVVWRRSGCVCGEWVFEVRDLEVAVCGGRSRVGLDVWVQPSFPRLKFLWGDEEVVVEDGEEFDFEATEFCGGDASNFGVVSEGVVFIVEEFRGGDDGSEDEAVGVHGIEVKVGLLLRDAVEVDQRRHETVRRTRCVVENTIQVGTKLDRRHTCSVK